MTTRFKSLEESIEIAAPASVVFERWTRFEDFPRFMEGISEVRRIGDRRLHWRAEFAGEPRLWDSEITVWIPGRRIAWRATSAGTNSSRVVCVEDTRAGTTRLTLKMLIDPGEPWARAPGPAEIAHRFRRNLLRFRRLLESDLVKAAGCSAEPEKSAAHGLAQRV